MLRFRLVSFVLLASLCLLVGCGDSGSGLPNETDVVAGWDSYGGDAGGRRHSPLDQITPENVASLEVAWTYNHGDVLSGALGEVGAHGTPASTTFQNTPILVDDTLYVCSPFNKVIALDAETGAERWKYDPEVSLEGQYLLNCRGVSAWTDARARPGSLCSTRIFTGTIDARLMPRPADPVRTSATAGRSISPRDSARSAPASTG